MTRESYQVVMDDDGNKVIHYDGFLWWRDNHRGDLDEKTGEPLDYACTQGSWYYVPIAGNEGRLEEAVAEAFEQVQQYQADLTEAQYLEHMEEWGSCPSLHLDEVTLDTEVGFYHYDTDY